MTLDLDAIAGRSTDSINYLVGQFIDREYVKPYVLAHFDEDVPALLARLKVLEAQRARLLWMTDLPMGSKPSVDLIDFADAIRQTINSPGCQYCPPTPGCTSCSLDGDCECYDHQHLS